MRLYKLPRYMLYVPCHFSITTFSMVLQYMLREMSIYSISCRKLSLTRLSESSLSYNVELAPLTSDDVLTLHHQASAFDGGDYDAAGSSFAYEVGTKECLALIEILTSPLYGLGFG